MSEENVELVRRGLEALDRRDLSAWLALNDEDCEVVPSRDWPEPGARGPEAVFDWYLPAFDYLQPFRTADTEFIDPGAEKVLLQYRTDLRHQRRNSNFAPLPLPHAEGEGPSHRVVHGPRRVAALDERQ
jgi:ketosteroid isomerase-like protein